MLKLSRFRIAQRMMVGVVVSGAVLALLWVAMLFWLFNLEVESRKQSLIHSAETIMSAADARVAFYSAILETLVTLNSTQPTTVALLETQAQAIAQKIGDAWLLMATEHGQQLFNTRAVPGIPLPVRGKAALEAHKKSCATGRPQVSDVGVGPVANFPVITVNYPMTIEHQCYVLAAVFPAAIFYSLMDNLPDKWLAGIVDDKGRYVTRSLKNDETVGKPASAGWIRTMRANGIHEYKSREGIDLVTANIASPISGWGSSVAVEKAALYAPFYRSLFLAAIGGVVTIGTCLFLVAGLGRQIARAVATARGSAIRVVDPDFQIQRTGEPDIDDIIDAHAIAAERIAKHDESMGLAAQEVNHRAKNLLAVVSSFSRFIGRDAKDALTFRDRLNDRLKALSLSQDVLISHDWRGGDLREIIEMQVRPFAGSRLTASGDTESVPAESVQSLSLLFHELATNASKHGSFSHDLGTVHIAWNRPNLEEKADVVRIVWTESGVSLSPPSKRGFGSVVIEQSSRSLGGEPLFDYTPNGLIFQVDIKILRLASNASTSRVSASA